MESPEWISDYLEVLFAYEPARTHLIVGHYWHYIQAVLALGMSTCMHSTRHIYFGT